LNILYTSVECYPVAKVGGLADVVGALPKYINNHGHDVTVIMPKYDLPWISTKEPKPIFKGELNVLDYTYSYSIQEIDKKELGFRLLLVDIPELLFRKGVYADDNSNYFTDEVERYCSYNRAVLDWVLEEEIKPDIIHCHDHHTALTPFMMTKCDKYSSLKDIPTVLTIHNEKYRGRFSWQKSYLIPEYSSNDRGLLDWDNMIDPLACGIKCCWKMTTVSPSYMHQLLEEESDLSTLFQQEKEKAIGLINGIDNEYWNPKTDKLLTHKLKSSRTQFKQKNKKALCSKFNLDPTLPLFSFIGRLAFEKGADLLPRAIESILKKNKKINFIILGTGMATLERELNELGDKYGDNLSINIMYNEGMAHEIYAGSDFLLMPSRVEPCGLNQMYALRYGTIPIVRSTGGLIDTVNDIKFKNGNGIRFDKAENKSVVKAIKRALHLFSNETRFLSIADRTFDEDFSWDASASNYIKLYEELTEHI